MNRARAIIISLVLLFLISITSIVYFYTDYLWFGEIGYREVFLKIISVRFLTGLVFAVFFWLFFIINILIARRMAPKLFYLTPRIDLQTVLQQIKPYVDRFFAPIVFGGSLIIAFLVGLGMSGQWDLWLRYFNQAPSAIRDPIFNRSLSYYFFSLPALESLQSFFFMTLFLTAVASMAVHFIDGGIVPGLGKQTFAPHVKAHISWLAAFLMIDLTALWWLNINNLLYAPTGNVVFGASYTDIHATMPALRLLMLISLVAAVLFIVNIWIRGWRLPVTALTLLVATWLLGANIYPAIVQAYRVSPNEIVRERPYIKLNIENTRRAYNLDKIKERPYPALPTLDVNKLAANTGTTDNVRLWDWRPLKRTYAQIQEIRLYYTFNDVDIDRYVIDGKYRQVTLSARELSTAKLPETAKTWQNEHLVFTHGYGSVMSPVNEVTPEGLPEFFIKNIPPVSTADIKITRPQIYFGEMTNEYVITNTKTKEFDYPKGQKNQYTTYTGSGGIPINSIIDKAAFAYRFSNLKLFLSESITGKSRILFKRNVLERAKAIAPFLEYDSDPYVTIINGRQFWIIDAYTLSDRYPYSRPFNRTNNYVRNSVKVVVDAYNGDIVFYLVDPDDPIAATYKKMFPKLFAPLKAMPAEFRRHLRYPETLFSIQADMYKDFHMLDPQVFYNKEDMWAIPEEISDTGREQMRPYYTIMKLPGEKKEEFLLMLPFTPTGKANMVSWMAARNDFPHFGEILVFDFPKDRLIFGPMQIEARIDQDPEISRQLSLWNQQGSRVIRGNLLVIPIEQSLIYVEPLYLQSEQGDLPELKRVVVGYGDRLAMEATFEEALSKVFSGTAAPTPKKSEPKKGEPRSTSDLISEAGDLFNKAQEAAKSGDWATYGDEIKKLGDILEQLKSGK